MSFPVSCTEEGMHSDCQAEAKETGRSITCPACAQDCSPGNVRYCLSCQVPETQCSPMCGFITC